MQNNNKKFGSLYSSKQNTENKSKDLFSSNANNLFFEPFSNPILKNELENKNNKENQKFLNDVDSSLIMENIDNTAKNKVVKINLKLKTLEKNIAKITEELKVLELFNLDKDKARREELSQLKLNLIAQMNDLKSEKNKFGLIYILSAYTNNKINLENIKKIMLILLNGINKYYYKFLEHIKTKDIFRKIFSSRS